MTISNRVIHLAEERALFRFRVTMRSVLRAAGAAAQTRVGTAQSADEEQELRAAHRFILHEGVAFQQQVDAAYRDLLTRALGTMYTDLRVPLDRLSADDLSLVDDDTVNRQIRIDHAVRRLRDADNEQLQRLNLIIGRMHGKNDAKERENPFRPYLMARALHQVLNGMVVDRNVLQRLFDLLSEALAGQLSDFYQSIREVFESNGIHAQLLAEKSPYYGGALPERVALALSSHVIPDLQRALDVADAAATPQGIQGFVNGIFHAEDGPANPLQAGSQALLARLNGFQQQAAHGGLFALNERIGPDEATKLERVAIDVVAVLFDLILADEQIADRFRTQIARLQIPFLKAAMLMPAMLQQAQHPARQLVNRMGSAAVGIDPASAPGAQLEREITRIVTRILAEFSNDLGMFAACLAEFEKFLAQDWYRTDPEAQPSVVALEEAEDEDGERQPVLPAWLDDFSLDPRVLDFIATTWVRVLERERALPPDRTRGSPAGGFHSVLPDLVWSVQGKQNAQERGELVRMLPGLVKRIEAGLALLSLTPDETRRALDQLVAVHTQVLRGAVAPPRHAAAALPELRARFERQKTDDDAAYAEPLESGRLQAALAKRGVSVDLDMARDTASFFDADADADGEAETDWLDRVDVGTCIERWSDDGFKTGWLVWISRRRTLYLVRMKNGGLPVVYSRSSLVKSLREGSLRLTENAPVFERAVQSLLQGLRSAAGRA